MTPAFNFILMLKARPQYLLDHYSKDIDNHLTLQVENQAQKIQRLEDKLAELSIPKAPFIFKIENVSQKFTECKEKSKRVLYSDPFFCLNGYKARLQAWLSDPKTDSHLSIYFQSLKGPFDDSLEWPMPYDTIRFKLFINGKHVMEEHIKGRRDAAKDRFIKPVESVGNAYGFDCVYPHDKIPNRINDVPFHLLWMLN